ncbi:VCBS repeat-containing protein [Streptomyces sp. G2]|uniref:FG-GAP-like repeat-containing protein n=1 Tax=Streptomyces sp. G2 TaxID=1684471 RepID=UPI00202F7E34|nr:FG-GAP-like repeat-containing protein [Streptomyces sp. G2]MCM1951103.1 VCBS repeat-containing protein [Streptomyces sp. G2]
MSRRAVSAAITTVLAVTLGTGALSVPAAATPLPATVTAEAATAPVAYPVGNGLPVAVGKTGFLLPARVDGKQALQWTRFTDGTVTTIDAPMGDSTGTDVIMTGRGTSPARSLILQLRDMAPGGGTVTMDLRPLNATYVKAVSKDTILAQVTKPDGTVELRLVTSTGGTLTQRKVEGVPAGAQSISSTPARDGSVLLSYALQDGTSWERELAMVDLAAAKAVPVHRLPYYPGQPAFSATHLVWEDYMAGGKVYARDRATGAETMIDFGLDEDQGTVVGLLDSWQLYGTAGTLAGDGTGDSRPHLPFTAKSLASGQTVKLLDYAYGNVQPGPDNTVFVRGGSVEHGDGLFRISLGADGTPVAEAVAVTGLPVALGYLGARIPQPFDVASPVPLEWKLSRENADVDLTITHRATGKSFSKTLHLYSESAGSPYYHGDNTFGITWSEIAAGSQMGRDAEVGTYDWSFTGRPQNGVGPAVEASGSFTAVKNASSPHDLDWDGGPDLLVRDTAGVLWRADSEYDPARKTLTESWTDRIGPGWQIYDRIETIGGVGGGAADFVARDKSGVLWLYDVTGNGYKPTIAGRKQIGGGWNTYTQLTGGSDLDGDGRPDLVAVDKAGALWFYKGTGNVAAPFAARKKIGTGGWGIYNRITLTGNIGGAAGGDLIARDKDGVLWLYLGKSDGTFTARKQVGGGWGAYTDTIGIGDANRDGRPDLFAYGPNKTSYFYAGTGDYRKPFATRVASPILTEQPAYNHVS